MNLFWSHTLWYLILGLATLTQVIYTLYHSKDRLRTFAFYLSLVGLPLYFETFILIFLDAYAYFPKIIQNPKIDPYNDVLAGNLFSQFGVASSALLLAVRRKPFYWNVIVSFIYAMVEVLFEFLGIYRHHWWKTWMTFIALFLFFVISKWMYAHLTRGVGSIYFYGYLILGMFPICTILFFWGVLDLFGYMRFTTTLFPDHPRISRYGLYLTFTLVNYILVLWGYFQKHWIWKIVTLVSVGTLIYLGYRGHLLLFWEGAFVPIGIIVIFWMYFSVWILDTLYRGRQQEL
ncbi:hypothetical protein [Paenibacillus whitsoniae]|uniref:Uncharacterized protein n=1 Tax=Paenibacillus whitsoniae TaxID=2496558 RepID=A0A430JK83_9BACL|nr:hypothetical protein [Paenibacillus whitsoniae]RTE11429.1 hypothetical protein EJQ19_02315 [Paenibacillus whitsoniae]